MGKKVFISYSHAQIDWVKNRLVPCLKAGGAEVLIDYKIFDAGYAVVGQMDATQDRADLHLLALTDEYLASEYCRHEMNRAVALDPQFQKGVVLPVIRAKCQLPIWLTGENPPLYVDLQDDKDAGKWGMLMKACEVDLGVSAPGWLRARDDICLYIGRGTSVNMVTYGRVKWRELLEHVRKDYFTDFGTIDVQDPKVTTRKALVEEILRQCGTPITVTNKKGEDLVILGRTLDAKQSPLRLIIKHFHEVKDRKYYDNELFSTLRYLMTESQKLVLLIQSRKPYVEILPHDHPLSSVTNLKVVELRGDKQ